MTNATLYDLIDDLDLALDAAINEDDEATVDALFAERSRRIAAAQRETDTRECAHVPEACSLSYSGESDIIDINCEKCGSSGSFRIADTEVMW